MPELFQNLLAAGIPFVAVVSLGIYLEQRWSSRRKPGHARPARVPARH